VQKKKQSLQQHGILQKDILETKGDREKEGVPNKKTRRKKGGEPNNRKNVSPKGFFQQSEKRTGKVRKKNSKPGGDKGKRGVGCQLGGMRIYKTKPLKGCNQKRVVEKGGLGYPRREKKALGGGGGRLTRGSGDE